MKAFDLDKVSSIAIDRPNHQQIYVHDHEHREEVIKTLLDMGFYIDDNLMDSAYRHLPIIVIIKEKVIFTVGSVAVIAAAIQCGVKIISYDDMVKLISDDEI